MSDTQDTVGSPSVKNSTPTVQAKATAFSNLFRFATCGDYVLMTIGVIAALGNGASFPFFAMIFGDMADAFGPNSTADEVVEKAGFQAMLFAIVGAGSFFMSFLMMATWMTSGERQSIRFRKAYFEALLKQEVGWYDTINPNTLATQVASETFAVQGAIGEKVPTFIMTLAMTIGGFVVAYIRGWLMSVVCTSALPVMALATFVFAWVIQNGELKQAESYGIAGGQAEQAINAIKTVKYLTGEQFELKKYSSILKGALDTAVSYGFYTGLGIGLVFMVCFLDYAIGFWYGSVLIEDKSWNHVYDRPYSTGDVLTIFFAIMIGGFSLGQATPCIENFSKGKIAGYQIFEVLDRVPLILIDKPGKKIDSLKGDFIFTDVEFAYPNQSDIQILKKLNLRLEAGKKTALVGESGCGKSTVFQLIQRFYDCQSGSLTLDDVDYQDLDLHWLRDQIGYVGQQPILFATSIRENMKFAKKNATESEIIEALKKANAWEFIDHLPQKLDTYVGTGGGNQLSGGQKQRICIARAILKNPKILILDEATSALDKKNERQIQETLDFVSQGRTTLVIAHRLTTVLNSDKIVMIGEGRILEEGTHNELLQQRGLYHDLIQIQIQKNEPNQSSRKFSNSQNSAHHVALSRQVSKDSVKQPIEQGLSNLKQAGEVEQNEDVESNELCQEYIEDHKGVGYISGHDIFGSKLKSERHPQPTSPAGPSDQNGEQSVANYNQIDFREQISPKMNQNLVVSQQEQIIHIEQQTPNNQKVEVVHISPDKLQIDDIRLLLQSSEEEQGGDIEQLNGDDQALRYKQEEEAIKKKQENEEEEQIEQEEDDDLLNTEEKQMTEAQKLRLKARNNANFTRLFMLNQPERPYFYMGIFWAMANGIPFPAIGLIMALMIQTLSDPSRSDYRERSDLLSLLFVLLGVAILITYIFQFYFFTRTGENLTYRVRQDCFKKITRMPIAWFDKPKNNPGSLAARLAADCSLINGLTSTIIGIQISNFSSLIVGTIIAFASSWQVSLVSVACMPMMIISGQVQAQFVQGFSETTDEAYQNSGNLIYEAVTNIRTVSSFANQDFLLNCLSEKLKLPASKITKKAVISGLLFGFSQMVMFIVYAITFYCGAVFYRQGWVEPVDMFAAIFALMNASFGAGNNSQFMGDIGAGRNAAANIFKLLDQEDEYDLQQIYLQNNKLELVQQDIKGKIQFENVKFQYPSRKKIIFQNLNFEINTGEQVAFVGESGHGKSTIIQLLLRYYDIMEGRILIDDVDIRQFDIHNLRSQLGVVSQEPILFNGSIRENIIYNVPGVTEEMMRNAAQEANALGFIMKNEFELKIEAANWQPQEGAQNVEHVKAAATAVKVAGTLDEVNQKDVKVTIRDENPAANGFDKQVGPQGTQISGGQKQRIAIARILLQKPQIMILDEATSALDAQNQQIVQESLDQIMKDQTSVIVAHRLSTIKDSNKINVIENGQIAEVGTFGELLQRPNGIFSALHQGQETH